MLPRHHPCLVTYLDSCQIVEDGSVRYVANENITATPIDDDEADAFLDHDTIGKYFRKRERQEDRRWAFVPSQDVEAEYPDS